MTVIRLLDVVMQTQRALNMDVSIKQMRMLLSVAMYSKGIDLESLRRQTNIPDSNLRRYIKDLQDAEGRSLIRLDTDPSQTKRFLATLTETGKGFVDNLIALLS